MDSGSVRNFLFKREGFAEELQSFLCVHQIEFQLSALIGRKVTVSYFLIQDYDLLLKVGDVFLKRSLHG